MSCPMESASTSTDCDAGLLIDVFADAQGAADYYRVTPAHADGRVLGDLR